MFRMFLKQAVLKPKYMYMYLRWFSNEALLHTSWFTLYCKPEYKIILNCSFKTNFDASRKCNVMCYVDINRTFKSSANYPTD